MAPTKWRRIEDKLLACAQLTELLYICFVLLECAVRISRHRHHPPFSGPLYINLAEVTLFDASGRQIPNSLLRASASTVHKKVADLPVDGFASNCIDSDLSTLCHTNVDDPEPQLAISYPCEGGLSRVRVLNHAVGEKTPIARRIMAFTLSATTGLDPYQFNFPGLIFQIVGE